MRIRALINKKRRCKIEGHMLGKHKMQLEVHKIRWRNKPVAIRKVLAGGMNAYQPLHSPPPKKNLMDNGKWYRPKNNMIPFALISLWSSDMFFFADFFLFIDEQKSAKGVRGTSRGGSPAVSAIIQKYVYNPCGDFKKPNVKPITHFHLLHVWL